MIITTISCQEKEKEEETEYLTAIPLKAVTFIDNKNRAYYMINWPKQSDNETWPVEGLIILSHKVFGSWIYGTVKTCIKVIFV